MSHGTRTALSGVVIAPSHVLPMPSTTTVHPGANSCQVAPVKPPAISLVPCTVLSTPGKEGGRCSPCPMTA